MQITSELHVTIDADAIADKKGLEPYGAMQTAIDNEVIRLMQPYIPMDQGILTGAFQRTSIGSGIIRQSTPYARYLYYGELYVDPMTHKGAFHDSKSGRFWSRPGVQKIPSGKDLHYDTTRHPMAGAKWFDRMKADHTQDILNVAKEAVK